MSEPHLNLWKFPVRNKVSGRDLEDMCNTGSSQSSVDIATDSSELLVRTGFFVFVFL